jgi:hypothetical protein
VALTPLLILLSMASIHTISRVPAVEARPRAAQGKLDNKICD